MKNTQANRERLRKAMWREYDRARGNDEARTEVHRRWCRALARLIGWRKVKAAVPISKELTQQCLALGDFYLNGTSLRQWDDASRRIAPWCLSDGVCVLKEVARYEAEKSDK